MVITKDSVISSFIWKFIERASAQFAQLFIQIILARLLSPGEFGTLAIVLVIVNIGQVIVQGGFNTALVQKKNPTNEDYSSILYLSLIVALIIYLILFYSSPFIARLYSNLKLSNYIRVVSITLFPAAFNSVQNAYVSKHFQFKSLLKSSLFATLTSGFIGIVFAYLGFGVWSLILQNITYNIFVSLALWFLVKWRPIKVFNKQSIKELFSFGSRMFISTFVYYIYLDIRTLLIGKYFNKELLGFYQRGEQLPKTIVNNIDGSIQAVILPTLSEFQDNIKLMKNAIRKSLKISSTFVFPIMIGMFLTSDKIIKLIFTEKWLSSDIYFKIFCLSYALWPILTITLQPMKALGNSQLFLRLEIIKRGLGLIIIFVSLQFGPFYVAIGFLIERLLEVIINFIPNIYLINYSFFELVSDIWETIAATIGMAIVVLITDFLNLNYVFLLILQIIFGASTYVLIILALDKEILLFILDLLKKLKK